MKHIIYISLLLISCSQGNIVRQKASQVCRNVRIPVEAIANSNEIVKVRNESYLPARTYNAMVDHAKTLVVCGEALSCVIDWTEWERDCEKSKTLIDKTFGISCKLEKPTCKVEVE